MPDTCNKKTLNVIVNGKPEAVEVAPSARLLDVLRTEQISKASAAQRSGRAGRTGPGVCFRLWSVAEDRGFSEFELPEIRRVDLAGPALLLVGSEAHGLPRSLVDAADQRVTIPMQGEVESLNAAVAGSLLAFEAARQRRAGTDFRSGPADGPE